MRVYFLQEDLARVVCKTFVERAEMLDDYFSMEVSCGEKESFERAILKSLPMLFNDFVPDFSSLALFVLGLATEVSWYDEEECFKTFCR